MKTSILFAIILFLAVPAKDSLSAATYGQEVVAAVLLAEARGEGEKGMQAVAEVIRTRADKKGVSMLAVIKPVIFSSLNGTNRDALLKKYRCHPMFDDALKIARTAYNEPHLLTNVTRNATHFVVKTKAPYWARGKRPVATIGNHAFYRLARY